MIGFRILFSSLILALCFSCRGQQIISAKNDSIQNVKVVVGAQRVEEFLPLLQNKKVGLVVNHSSLVFFEDTSAHLVDTLLKLNVEVSKIFSPEHGFRGTADPGELVAGGIDQRTGLPVISLYGNNKKPSLNDIADLDILIFDIQDVGARFYTYISTMHYVMEACAENNKTLLVLDRPNPNGFYVDGPVLDTAFRSFVGMHPVPVVHGMTVGEYAQMINSEGWLKGAVKCDLRVISCLNYDHNTTYQVPVKPSPNLPNMTAIYLYPSLCFFEGTSVSVGRGTEFPFQVIGHPAYPFHDFSFIPQSTEGAKEPLHKNDTCYGKDLTAYGEEYFFQRKKLNLAWLIEFYNYLSENKMFFNSFFEKLAGNNKLRQQIIAGKTEDEIRLAWQPGLEKFKAIRKKYLLYPDF